MSPWALAGFGAWLAVSACLAAIAGPWCGALSVVSALLVAALWAVGTTLWPLEPAGSAVPVYRAEAWGGVIAEAGPTAVVLVLPVPDPSLWTGLPAPASVAATFVRPLPDGQARAISAAKLDPRPLAAGESAVVGPVTVRARDRGWLVEAPGGTVLIGDRLTAADLADARPDEVIGGFDADTLTADALEPLPRVPIVLLGNLGRRPEAAVLWDLGFPVRLEHPG